MEIKNSKIEVNPLAHKPNEAWSQIKSSIPKREVQPMPLDTPISPDKVSYLVKNS